MRGGLLGRGVPGLGVLYDLARLVGADSERFAFAPQLQPGRVEAFPLGGVGSGVAFPHQLPDLAADDLPGHFVGGDFLRADWRSNIGGSPPGPG